MKRQTKNLDGTWQIAFDHGNIGKQRKWMLWKGFLADAPREYIEVPSCWERFRQDYEGTAWYGHTFTVPGEWEGQSVRIHFGAVNYLAEVYLNDQPIGYHEGGYTDFSFEIGDLLRFDKPNTLILRVIGPILTQDKVIDGIGRDDMPHWRGAIAGGVWQSVKLVATGQVHVTNTFADPDLDTSTVRIDAAIENLTLRNRDVQVLLQMIPVGVVDQPETTPGSPVAEAKIDLTAAPGNTKTQTSLHLESPRLWSPESPFLYRLHTQIHDKSGILDQHSTRFGMRELKIDKHGYWLNGQKILVKSAFFEGLYPTSLAAPPDDAFVRNELQLAKEAGFNLLRPWRKPQPPIVYRLADEMGIMFVGTMPIECMSRWPTMTPYAERRMKNEVRESVRRDRNHPCIVLWEIFNEIMRPSLQRIKHRVTRQARALDPSRFILDESGGFGGGAFFYPAGSREPFQVNDVHNYPGAPFDQAGYDKLLALGKTKEQLEAMGRSMPENIPNTGGSKQIPGGFVHVSEIGYGSLPDLEANVRQYRKSGNPLTPDCRYHTNLLDHFRRALAFAEFDKIFPSVRDFCLATQNIHATANKLMLEAIRMNPDIDGFTIHAYTDGDWVVGAGLLDIFRNPKKPYFAAMETNRPIYLALRTAARNVYAPDELELTAGVASELPESFEGKLEGEVIAPDKEIVKKIDRSIHVEQGVTPLISERLTTKGIEGLCTLRARLLRDKRKITENSYQFRVIPREKIPVLRTDISVADPSGKLPVALNARGVSFDPFDQDTPAGRLVLANATALHFGDSASAGPALVKFVQSGGTVIYLDIPHGKPIGSWAGNQHLASDWLPVKLCLRPTKGLWSPFAHIIRKHPVSQGLPSDKIMDRDYVNVHPRISILNIAADNPAVPSVGLDLWSQLDEDIRRVPVATLGLGWRPGEIIDERDYRGPGPVILGADLIEHPCGKGRLVLSTLRLVDSLGKDPVADILLTNIINWAAD